MRLAKFKELLAYKLRATNKLPNDEVLSTLTHEAMLWVANKYVSAELLRYNETDERVYRQIADDCFIAVPDMPDFSDTERHLMIDEPLSYAVMNEVAFMHTADSMFRQLALECVADYVANFKKALR